MVPTSRSVGDDARRGAHLAPGALIPDTRPVQRSMLATLAALVCAAVPRIAAAQIAVTHPFTGVALARGNGTALAVVDLCANGVAVRATARSEAGALASTWAQRIGAQVAINADFFTLGPTVPVDGRARGNNMDWPAGDQFAQASRTEWRQYWQFGLGMAELVTDSSIAPSPGAAEIVGGHNVIIDRGAITDAGGKPLLLNAYRHTAIGLSADRRTLFLFAVNSPVNAHDLAQSMITHAAATGAPAIDMATNEDGGGSTQMYVQGPGLIVSSTRPVANHLGVYATGSGAPINCVPRYAAQFVAQSFPGAHLAAVTLHVGESVDGWFEVRNTGTATWHRGTTKLAPIPRDMPSPLGDANWIAPNRVSTVASDVPPGATARFPARLTGNTVGDYSQTFGFVEEAVTWFADPTLGGGPPDDFIRVHVIVVPAEMTDAGIDAGTRDASSDAWVDAARDDADSADAGSRRDAASADGGDAGAMPMTVGGCGCRTSGRDARGSRGMTASALVAVAMGLACRRRRHRSRTVPMRR